MEIKKIDATTWTERFSEIAHMGMFAENKSASFDRIDYALLALENDVPVGYQTCRELDSKTVYWQYGGVFEPFRGTETSKNTMQAFLRWHKDNYDRCVCYIENTNKKALNAAVLSGYIITGIRMFKGFVLLEHLLEFGEKNGN